MTPHPLATPPTSRQPVAGRWPRHRAVRPFGRPSSPDALSSSSSPLPRPPLPILLLAVLPALLPFAACAPPAPVTVSTEAAFRACEAGTLAELRRRDATTRDVSLDPIGSARVERPEPPAASRRGGGGEGVALVIAGRGSVTTGPGGGGSGLRYACLVGTGGDLLFVDVVTEGGGEVLEECRAKPGKGAAGDPRSCLRDLAAGAESALAVAEAEAISRGRRRHAGGGRSAEIDDPAAASIGAWRVYRDSECARRHGGVGDTREVACQVELTRARVRELRQG